MGAAPPAILGELESARIHAGERLCTRRLYRRARIHATGRRLVSPCLSYRTDTAGKGALDEPAARRESRRDDTRGAADEVCMTRDASTARRCLTLSTHTRAPRLLASVASLHPRRVSRPRLSLRGPRGGGPTSCALWRGCGSRPRPSPGPGAPPSPRAPPPSPPPAPAPPRAPPTCPRTLTRGASARAPQGSLRARPLSRYRSGPPRRRG